MEFQRFYTINEISEILRTSRGHVSKLIKNGQLKALRLSSRCVRIRESSLQKLLGGPND